MIRHTATLTVLGMLLAACSGSGEGGQTGTGGSTGTGGGGTGGGAAGGASGKGGAASGGVPGTGGSASGGISGAGGGAAGGISGSGGRAGGAGGSGGLPGSGGAGGQSGSGAGGSGAGGAAGSAAPAGLVNTYDGARSTTVSFDAAWKFHLGDVTGAQATTFDDSSWTALDVPHDWSISLPFTQNSPAGAGGGYLNGGVGWYRKTFTLPASSAGQKIFVQFDGVYMDSTVYLNGTQVGARPYGFSSFECDLTAAAKLGASNVLAVRVNNQQPSSRWYSGSGIYRHTWLKTVNPVRVAYTGTAVTTPQVSTTSATVDIAVTVQNDTASAQSVTVASSVGDATGTEVGAASSPATSVAAGKTATVTQTVTVANPKLWSLAAPTLYSALTTVSVGGAVVDTYTTRFGIRTFAFSATSGFTLNGAAVKLNGTCNHHDLGALGAAVNHRAIEKHLQMLKSMGVNALRTSHNPPAPELLDLADQLGLLVMDEAFDCWDQAKNQYDYARFFNQWSTIDIGDMVSRDRNHPSIIIWSIGNEIQDNNNATIAASLISAVKAKDSTRAIGQANANASPGAQVAAMEDVVGLNYAPYTYDSTHSSNPSWKLFASESSSAVRSRGVYKTPVTSNILTSSDNQCSSYDNSVVSWGTSAEGSWSSVNTRAFIAGEFIWTGFDYIGEPTPYSWPSKSSYFGAIDSAGFPKDIFYFYQSKWGAAGPTMVHIVPMDWTSWTAGQSVTVFVYTNADSVELFLNGTSQGSKTMNATTGHLQWSVPFATGTLQAKASKGGTVVATDTVKTAGAAAKLALGADRTSIAADGRDLAYVEVDVVDAQGVVVPKAGNSISVAVSGPGALVGLDAGDSTNHDSYKGTSHAAFNGKLMAIIQSTGTAGTVTVTATSGSLASGSATITTQAP
ncbi:MAG TPA: glycoside hydrolase family 2 TIM barrel-domain containing protein [Polyangia bacterium]|nr:glycoside hydrolase family 2 TIM barrel-domain containing protein [Polyangia bacterium]